MSFKHQVYFEYPDMNDKIKKKIKRFFQIKRRSGGGDCGSLEVFEGNVYRIAFEDRKVQQRVLENCNYLWEDIPSFIIHETPQSLLPDLSSITTTPPEADNPKMGLSSPPETEFPVAASPLPAVQNHDVHFESSTQNPLKESSVAGQHPKDELLSSGGNAQLHLDKDMVTGDGEGDGFKHSNDREEQGVDKVKETFIRSQAHKVDIVAHLREKPVETEFPSIPVQPHQSGSHKASSLRNEETQRRIVYDQPGPRNYMGPAAREVQGENGSQRYFLHGGVSVHVCRGDITKVTADALVNAANGYLDHVGGVAAALSHTGGPEVQRQSHALVRQHGKYATGEAVMTTGGRLQCNKLIHIVGPVQGEAYGRERPLLTRSVGSVLKLADDNKFRSIAIPCISSGIFKVPISVCAEAIVTAVFDFEKQSQHLKRITLIDTREEVVEALKAACNRIFCSADAELKTDRDRHFHDSPGAFSPGSSGTNPVNHGEEERIMNDDDDIHKPLKQHVHQEEVRPAARHVQEGKESHSYVFHGGVSVLVCHGDITKVHAAVLVNVANRNLKHDEGVAAALSRAGGPQVQQESKAHVEKHGRCAAGDIVMTTGGLLQCNKLSHIVSPVQGEETGREKSFLNTLVLSVLQLADENKFMSIAMPCICSGISKVSISESAEAIVTAVFDFGKQSQHLKRITLIDIREEVVEAFKVACDRKFSLTIAEPEASGNRQESTGASNRLSNSGADPVNIGTDFSGIKLEIVVGLIEKQQVDVIVSPMKDHDPRSTGLGNMLSEIIGRDMIATAFSKKKKQLQRPVEVDVNGLEKLYCRKVFFVNLLPWDPQQHQQHQAAVRALKQGLQNILTSCQDQGFRSVAFPMLGTGKVLRFPQDVAQLVLLEEIGNPKLNRHDSKPLVVHVVMHPDDHQTHKAMLPQQTHSHEVEVGGVSFSRYFWKSPDMATAMVGGVMLQLVHGDIIHEKTDVIVNTITSTFDQSGVSKAILKAAGTNVKEEFGVKRDACSRQDGKVFFQTEPGLLNCKMILHATFFNRAEIHETCETILKGFESNQHSSISFPALGTGNCGMDPKIACKAMLDGIEAAVRSMGPTSLTLVRIVFMQRDVLKDFRSVLQNRCEETARQKQGQGEWVNVRVEEFDTNTNSSSPPFSSKWDFFNPVTKFFTK